MRRIFFAVVVVSLLSVSNAQVISVFSRTGAVTANSGDYSASQVTNAVNSSSTYSDPAWLTGLAWSKILTAPLTTGGTNNLAVGIAVMNTDSITGEDDTALGHAALNALTSGGDDTAVGNDALASVTTGDYNTAVGSLAGEYITTGVGNTAVGKQALQMVTTANDNTVIGHNAGAHITTSANTAVGKDSQNYNATGEYNTSLGQDAMWGGAGPGCSTGGTNYSGSYNTAVGQGSFCNVSSGSNNTLVGWESGVGMTAGSDNVIVGYLAGTTSNSSNENVSGSSNTWVGYQAGPGTSTQLTNSTAIGANALVSRNNSLVLGGTGTYAVNVGIGTATPSNVFTIAQNAGNALADGWNTYSSRRWKTNISTLHDALTKVQQLRGVSYDLKSSGKHELGVVAEEVGAVVPEIVSWNPNSGEADGVDYGRLSALLIEATKEQQGLIKEQQNLLAAQEQQIRAQQEQITRLTSHVKQIESALATSQRIEGEVRSVSIRDNANNLNKSSRTRPSLRRGPLTITQTRGY